MIKKTAANNNKTKQKNHVWSLCLHCFSDPMSFYARLLASYHLYVNRLQNSQHRKDCASFSMLSLFIPFRTGGSFSSQNLKEILNQIFVWSPQYCGKMQDGRRNDRNVTYIACTFSPLQIPPFCSFIPLTYCCFIYTRHLQLVIKTQKHVLPNKFKKSSK